MEVLFGSETAATLQEVEIRALLNEISVATKAKDAAALLAHHAPEVLPSMWLIRWYRGKGEVRRRTEAWFDVWF